MDTHARAHTHAHMNAHRHTERQHRERERERERDRGTRDLTGVYRAHITRMYHECTMIMCSTVVTVM